MITFLRKHPLLSISIGLLLLFSVSVFLYTRTVYTLIADISLWVRYYFGHFYLYLGLGFVLTLVVLAVLPLGKKRLGKHNDRPEYSLWSWFAMLYSAGMGAGILLRAIQEPVYMYQNPPLNTGIPPNIMALEYTFYQWGFTAWAFYGLFAIIIGYYLFVKNKKVRVSAAIEHTVPWNAVRVGIDVLAIITTVFGLVGALALGTTQISGGLQHLFLYHFGMGTTIAMVLLISLLAFVSVWKGVNKGIKIISRLNILIALIVLFYVFLQSDVLHILQGFIYALYRYCIDFIPMSIAYGHYNPGEAFLTDWTYYYWAFWIAWAPFTGIFIARISRGRTLREVLLGVLLIPSLGTFFWFSVFGDTAFQLIEQWGGYQNEFEDVFTATFVFFEQYPFHELVNGIILFLLVSFLVTSLDSAVFVLSMFTDGGKKIPSKKHRLLWSIIIAVFGTAMIVLGSAKPDIDVLTALQKLLIITSLPFSILMILMAVIFFKEFK